MAGGAGFLFGGAVKCAKSRKHTTGCGQRTNSIMHRFIPTTRDTPSWPKMLDNVHNVHDVHCRGAFFSIDILIRGACPWSLPSDHADLNHNSFSLLPGTNHTVLVTRLPSYHLYFQSRNTQPIDESFQNRFHPAKVLNPDAFACDWKTRET